MADMNTVAASDPAGTSSMFNFDEILKNAGEWLVTVSYTHLTLPTN